MVHKLLLLQEALDPLARRVEFLLRELGLAGGLGALERLKLIVRVQILPSDPLHELLVVNLAGHRHLKVPKRLLSCLYGHGRVVKGWKRFVWVLSASILHNVEHILDKVEDGLDEGRQLVEAHRA